MKVVVATGGSGGHIFPALYVADELKRRGCEVFFAGVMGKASERIAQKGYSVEELPAQGLVANSLKSVLTSFGSMLQSVILCVRMLKNIQPDTVVGFGGYGAFPVVFTAALLRYPTVIHEQNVLPGRANRVLARLVKTIAVSFAGGRKYFPSQKTVLTGCPSRKNVHAFDRAELLREFGFVGDDKRTVFVLGGSQGSRTINTVFLQTVRLLKESAAIQVIHVCGESDWEIVSAAYAPVGVPYKTFPFLEEMEKAYALADVVVSRAGAVTVTELASFQVPSVLIPYPYAQGHQKENAKVLVEAGLADMIEEKDLNAEKLRDRILEALHRLPRSGGKGSSSIPLPVSPNAEALIADEILALAHNAPELAVSGQTDLK